MASLRATCPVEDVSTPFKSSNVFVCGHLAPSKQHSDSPRKTFSRARNPISSAEELLSTLMKWSTNSFLTQSS